ncbi:hypothetical protein N0V93_002458 [Gnomoniopsis smithogilvyi]|uniref:Zn(2)-C6 fungal-type domain-containing protein n=1 Tax=Gnomoniopsis smithogilvyi TaxID=1191159 RepID=A0A9W9CXP0_9PEZI|nr:hypothetical protein N0V93_002458 [Gnomoniopsis smithogilvyi]
MVNTGKPSGACGVCRERRIKCDETKPVCLKCTRSGRICSGYSHGLKLRDQTQKTIIKARLGKPRAKDPRRGSVDTTSVSKGPATPASAATEPAPMQFVARTRNPSITEAGRSDWFSTGGNNVEGERQMSAAAIQQDSWSREGQVAGDALADPVLWKTIDTPVVDQARCYFLSNYVVYSPRSAEGGMLTFIPSLLATDNSGKEPFEDLFSAVSIATFSMRPNASHAAAFGRTYYGRGMEGLRKALGNKVLARSDATLASTILLGFYEVEAFMSLGLILAIRDDADETQGIVNEGVGLVSYNPHFKGAITLLQMREEEQFSTSHGTEMFNFVMQVLMRQYVLSLTCSDDDVKRWSTQASMRPKHQQPHLAAMYVGHLRQKAARLLAASERNAKITQDAIEVLGTAQKFEKLVTQRFDAEASQLLGERVEPSPNADDSYGSTLVYSDWWTASRSLNKYAFRLLICHIIADISDWLCKGPDALHFQGSVLKAATIAKRDIDSIIASIPYLCAWEEGKPRGASSPCGRDDVASTQGITSMMIIWPLYLAGKSRFATVEQKEYILRKLAWMAENRGVRHALGVSKFLKLQAAKEHVDRLIHSTPARLSLRKSLIEHPKKNIHARSIMRSTASFVLALAGLSLGRAAPSDLSPRQAAAACFVVGKETLPAEVADSVTAIKSSVTCGSATTIDNVPDVTSGAVSFSDIDFSKSSDTPLQFALNTFNTSSPLADTDLQTVQDQLNVYLATEAGLRSVGGSLAIKVPKFFLAMQVSRIQTAQGNPPTAAGQQVDHLRDKVTKNAAGESQALLDQVTQLATVLS